MHREWPGVIGPAGVAEQGIGTMGVPRNVGDPVVSARNPGGMGHPGDQCVPVHRRLSLAACGSQSQASLRGTAKRRQRSAAGRAAGSRSALIVLLKQGNSPWRTLWRKAKRRPADPVEGNMSGTSRLDPHVTVTRPDSLGDHPWMANLSVRGTGCANVRTSGSVGALGG